MSNDQVDPATLRTELDQIKEAMGLRERYEGAPRQWLLYAVLVAVAAALSQAVVLERLPGWYHVPIWTLVLGGGALVGNYYLAASERGEGAGATPSLAFQFAVVLFAFVPIQVALAPTRADVGYLAESASILGLILVLLGVAYLLMGNALRSFRIRRRDRLALHGGGVLMLVLGVAVPNVTVLREWGFAAFGVCYVAYALVAYVLLTG